MADIKRKPSEETIANKNKVSQLESSKPKDFSYADYVESDAVTNLKNQLSSLQKPGAYQSQWQQSMNDALNKYTNRGQFSYDVTGDALYQQYKDQYVTQGQMAMMDTMGQAAAMTGGYGNSYAQSVGQQAYQGYLQQLNDKVPELYQLALDKYNQEGQDLLNQYSLFADRENTDYGRYRDTVSDYNTERDYLSNQYNAERTWDYGQYSDAYNRAYGEHRDSVSDWQTMLSRADNYYLNSQNRDDTIFDSDRSHNLALEQLNESVRANKASESLAREQFNFNKQQAAAKASAPKTVENQGWKNYNELNEYVGDIIGEDGSGRSEAADYLVGLHQDGRISDADFSRLLSANGFEISNGVVVDTTVKKNEDVVRSLGTAGARAEKIRYMKN